MNWVGKKTRSRATHYHPNVSNSKTLLIIDNSVHAISTSIYTLYFTYSLILDLGNFFSLSLQKHQATRLQPSQFAIDLNLHSIWLIGIVINEPLRTS